MVKQNDPPETKNAYNRAYFAERRAKGFCTRCDNKAEAALCAECAAKRRAYRKGYSDEKQLCQNCGKPLDGKSWHKCNACLRKEREARKLAEPDRAGNERERRKQRDADGVCIYCGGLHGPRLEGRKWCDHCRLENSNHNKDYRRRLRDEIFSHYGGPVCSCPGCGCAELDFLTIDHVNNDGSIHRRTDKITSTTVLMRWLRRNGYPPGFQVLCFNCNFSKSKNMNGGMCIHQRRLLFPPEYVI